MGDGSEVAVVLRFVGGGHDAIYDVGGSGVEGVKGVKGFIHWWMWRMKVGGHSR